jgi:hypothetical protein
MVLHGACTNQGTHVRRNRTRGLALTAVAGLFLAGCGDGQASDEPNSDEQAASDTPGNDESQEPSLDQDDAEPPPDSGDGVQDPNDDIEDGVYRGNGVALPVPDGWSIDPAAFQQGLVAATPDDGAQQLTAQAIDTEQAEASSAEAADFDLESLLDGVRQQIDQDAEADEEIDVVGADQAHRLTYLQLPAQQEGQPETSATIVLAEGGDGLVGEFAYSAAAADYDDDIASLLVDEAGFDPESEPAEMPQAPQPSPDEGGDTEQPADGTG